MRIEELKVNITEPDGEIVSRTVHARITDEGDVADIRVMRVGSNAGPNLWDILEENQKDQVMQALQDEAERLDNFEDHGDDDPDWENETAP